MQEWPPEHAPLPGSRGERFQEQRIHIGFSIKQLAVKVDRLTVQKLNWIESSAGDNTISKVTTAQWQKMAELGMDIQYVLIGVSGQVRSKQEAALLENYRASSQENQDHLEAASASFKEQEMNFLLSKGMVWEEN